MSTTEKVKITIEASVNAPVEKVWKLWNDPQDVVQWNTASPDWHTPKAVNDLRPGGKFEYHMAAKDGSFAFDFAGVYDEVKTNELIAYTMGDDRKVAVKFTPKEGKTLVVTVFEAESENSIEMQQGGWQAILDNFKKYAESK
jgi:uncharacterized protein YndB with AHSA1/START domain